MGKMEEVQEALLDSIKKHAETSTEPARGHEQAFLRAQSANQLAEAYAWLFMPNQPH